MKYSLSFQLRVYGDETEKDVVSCLKCHKSISRRTRHKLGT